MKVIDKFLKKLHTTRNNFATYVLTLITLYLVVDRMTEILLIIFTGVSYSYWGPIQYCLAMACPMLAYAFSVPSEYSTSKAQKVKIFYVYIILLAVIVASMFTQWLNMGIWLFLVSVPGYEDLVTNFSELFRPALTSISFLIPITIAYKIFNFLYMGVNDSTQQTRSIWDYEGINLSDTKEGHGPFTCEMFWFKNSETGKTATLPEASRFQSTLVCGGSGSGKTSMVFEPFIARDLERKFFYSQVSKEMGFTALKTKIAVLNKPYSNEYLNKNFSLNMLSPAYGKETIYKSYIKKMILSDSPELTYRNCGITVMSPDKEISNNMIDVAKNFGFDYHIIDPSDLNSIGINPFVYDDPYKIATTISSTLKAMYNDSHTEVQEAYREDVILQAIENIAILLKEMYPRMNEGALPNLDDMLKMLTNFELVEKMCEIMAHDETLKEKHANQIAYFKKNFYSNGSGKEMTEKFLYTAISQLDNLLRLDGVKSILCNRHNNIDLDKALANSELIFVCTRRGDLGATSHKIFGLFFLIAFENAVLRRPGTEKSRTPYFLYIDEFPDFINKATEPIFTMFRKYKVGATISAQNLSQLNTPSSKENFRQTILANCANKIFTGNGTNEDLEWWSTEMGQHREWSFSDTIDFAKGAYDSKHGNVSWKFVANFSAGKLQSFSLKDCAFKLRSESGKPLAGQGKMGFLDSKYKEPQKIKKYDFSKFSNSADLPDSDDNNSSSKKEKFNPKNLNFLDDRNEFDPVQTHTTDSKYLFDNEDAIVVNFKNKKKDN